MQFPNPTDLIKPWEWNPLVDSVVWILVVIIAGLVILWTRAGRDRKHTPDQLGRNVEDFAGLTQESNGPVPVFLFVLFVAVGGFMILYPIITLIWNYNY
ncbi:MAG TPA: hypothetical protein VLQ48_16880 [Chloroflexia bacterium]|jgi:hypothetical protein|nr:hypothetical protein [Chloroflexia bacterium]